MNDVHGFTCYGSYGGWNSGDEAILATVENLIRGCRDSDQNSPSDIDVIVWKMNPDHRTDYQRRGRNIVGAKEFRKILSSLRRNQLIIGGGQLLVGDRTYKGLLYVAALTQLARWVGRPAIIIGLGVVGMERRRSRWITKRIIQNSKSVACRDQHSVDQLIQSGADPTKIELSADIVFSGAMKGIENDDRGKSRPTIAVGVHRAPIRDFIDTATMRSIIEAVADRFADHDIEVVSNDCRDGFDKTMLDELSRLVRADNVRYQHFTDVNQTIGVYASADCTISVRMHPLILSMIHGGGVVGIGRSQKVVDLAHRAGFDVFDPDGQDHTVLITMIQKAIDQPVNVETLGQTARKTFDDAVG